MDPAAHIPRPLAEDSAVRRPEARLALIELLDRDGRVRRSLDVHAWPVTLGRALDATWVLDDPHVAPRHASLAPGDDGVLRLWVGETRNGVRLDGRLLQAGDSAPLDAAAAPTDGWRLELGGQALRLRLAGAPVAAELPLGPRQAGTTATPHPASGRALLAMAAAWVAVQALHRWVRLDPGADLVQWLPWLLGLPTGLALWSALWALLSKLFRHGFDFATHAAAALRWLLAWEVLDLLLPQAGAALGWPLPWMAWHQWGLPLLTVGLLRTHLRLLLPQRDRAIDASLALLLVAGSAVNVVVNLRHTGRVFNEAYMHTLPPPALRLDTPQPVATVDAALGPLRDALLPRARAAASEDGDDPVEGDDGG